MTDLTAEQASPIVGVPAEQLRIWAFDRVGPKNTGAIMSPRYTPENLKAWLDGEGSRLARSIGR